MKFFRTEIKSEHHLSSVFIEAYSKICSWELLGVLKLLVEHRMKNGGSFFREQLFGAALAVSEFNMFVGNILPVAVCLDEFFISEDPTVTAPLIFLRNLLRSVKVVPIVLGTNAKISNLISEL